MSKQNRQPAGIGPRGGEFAPGIQPRADLTLDSASVDVIDASIIAAAAERAIGRALNASSYATEPGNSATDIAYRRGMEYADTCAAASLLNPHDLAARNQATSIIQLSIHRGAANNDTDRQKILTQIADAGLRSARPVTRHSAHAQIREMVTAAATTHHAAYGDARPEPDGPSVIRTPYQWEQLGMRNAFADAAATWADPASFDTVRASEAIRDALADGITDPDSLYLVARGQLGRDRDGNWEDPYAYLDEIEL